MGAMKKHPISWLPIDSRVLPQLLSFNHVHGIGKLFLFVELLTASLVVIGTLVLVLLSVIT